MPRDQLLVFLILGASLLLFAWGRWRYDLVALLALLAAVLTGVVPLAQAFDGFAHPAVVMVAAVLVISRALQSGGVVDVVMGLLDRLRGRENLQLTAQTGLTAALSAVVNNVGALALLIPVALRNAYRDAYSPAKSLMPMAFGSLLGGLVTLIGTPPNIIISTIRQDALGAPFAMFDFAPVGGAVAVAGLAFVLLVGWRLIPADRRAAASGPRAFEIDEYLMEVRAPEGGEAVGLTLEQLEGLHEDARVVGIAREDQRRLVPPIGEMVRVGDILILEGDPEALKGLIDKAGLEILDRETPASEAARSDEVDIVEVIVKPGSWITGRTPAAIRLRSLYRVNLLGLARHGFKVQVRLRDVRFQAGDVLMLQGARADLETAVGELGCIPLAERPIALGQPRRLLLSTVTFAAAVGVAVAGLLPIHIAFVTAVAALVLLKVIRLDDAYAAVDWPVIVLLGAMLPVGAALEATGGTGLVVDALFRLSDGLSPVWVLTALLVSTMMLSDLINNNATAVIMAPIGLTLAERLGVNADAFLMAVAIGASCAFLTPIGHQSNTLVLAPGGYRFGDYWRMGLPLEVVITVVAVPMLLAVWPL